MIIVRWKNFAINPKTKELELPDNAYNIHLERGGWTTDRDIYLWWKEFDNDKCKKIITTRWHSPETIKIEIEENGIKRYLNK